MKRTVIKSSLIFLSIFLLLFVSEINFADIVHAEETESVFFVTNAKVRPGNRFSVDIDIDGNVGLTAATIQVTFDSNALSLKEVQNGDAFHGLTVLSELTSPVTLKWENAAAVLTDGTFATLWFELDENVSLGETTEISVSYTSEDVLNNDEQVVFLTKDGAVTAVKGIPGDINGDGETNGKDLLRAKKYFAGWRVDVDQTALDVTGDGDVNGKDLLRLRKHFSDWDVEIFYGVQSSHIHVFGNWEYLNDENHIGTCECGQQRLEEHLVNEEDITEDEEGNISFTCSVCKHEFVFGGDPDVYSVIFTDENGSILSSTSFEKGEKKEIAVPDIPEKNGLRFVKWSTPPETIRTDKLNDTLIVYPEYVSEYAVTFYNEAGTIIASFLYAPSTDNPDEKIIYPAAEQKEGYDSVWSVKKEDLTDISKNISIYPVLTRKKCAVSFYDYNGTLLQESETLYGHVITAPISVTKWYFDYTTNEGRIFSGWKCEDAEGNILKTVDFSETWNGEIADIKQDMIISPYYEAGCNEPKLIFSKKSKTKLNLSLLIPKGYSVNAFSFKIDISEDVSIGALLHEYAIGSDFVDNENKNQFTVNELEKYFTYYFVSSEKEGTRVTADKSYNILDFEIYDNGGHLMSFADKDLSEIFSLNESESKLVYRIGSSAAKTEALSVEFQK